VVGVGRRDASFDSGLPVLLRAVASSGAPVDVRGAAGTRIFDQHWVPQVPTDRRIQPGDQISLGISHPCMTFDKWRWITLLDGEIVVDVVRTFF
jgi:D-serine dehydratase